MSKNDEVRVLKHMKGENMKAITFEVFDADPNQSGDCGWNVVSALADCTSREEIIEWAREHARESGEYDPTDRLWYRIDDGDDEGLTGSFLVGGGSAQGGSKLSYYAVCNVGGPISVEIEAISDEDAVERWKREDQQGFIDDARTDAEDHLGIEVYDSQMSESDFDALLEEHCCEPVQSLDEVVMGQGPTTRVGHLAGGWYLWRVRH